MLRMNGSKCEVEWSNFLDSTERNARDRREVGWSKFDFVRFFQMKHKRVLVMLWEEDGGGSSPGILWGFIPLENFQSIVPLLQTFRPMVNVLENLGLSAQASTDQSRGGGWGAWCEMGDSSAFNANYPWYLSSKNKKPTCQRRSLPGSGRFPGGGNGNLLQYSRLANPMDRGAWRAIVHRVAKESDTTEATKQQQSQNKVEIVFQSSAGFNYP